MSDTTPAPAPEPKTLTSDIPVLINGQVLAGSATLVDNGDATYQFTIAATGPVGLALQQQLAANGVNFQLSISGKPNGS